MHVDELTTFELEKEYFDTLPLKGSVVYIVIILVR